MLKNGIDIPKGPVIAKPVTKSNGVPDQKKTKSLRFILEQTMINALKQTSM